MFASLVSWAGLTCGSPSSQESTPLSPSQPHQGMLGGFPPPILAAFNRCGYWGVCVYALCQLHTPTSLTRHRDGTGLRILVVASSLSGSGWHQPRRELQHTRVESHATTPMQVLRAAAGTFPRLSGFLHLSTFSHLCRLCVLLRARSHRVRHATLPMRHHKEALRGS